MTTNRTSTNDPFIFLIFSSRDKDLCDPDILWFRKQGYEVYIPDFKNPQPEDEMRHTIRDSGYVVVFMTPAALQSKDVLSQIRYAGEENKPMLCIQLTETVLPDELEQQFGPNKIVNKWLLPLETYQRKLRLLIPKDLMILEDISFSNQPEEATEPAMVPTPVTTTGEGYDDVTDIDGNVYKTVKIGNQIWTAENLKVTRLNDGTPIRNITDNDAWTSEEKPGFCFYDNDPANKDKYGVLYNFFAVETGWLAPKGWHVPTDEEWEQLVDFLGGKDEAGELLKSKTGWDTNGNGSDAVGFSALPGGFRYNGGFGGLGSNGYWWGAVASGTNAWFRYMHYSRAAVGRDDGGRRGGFSVRLVRDSENPADMDKPIPSTNPTVVPELITVVSQEPPKTQPETVVKPPSAITPQTMEPGSVTDIDGNVYRTVKIGNQIWTAENLKVTRLNDGTPIENITSAGPAASLKMPIWCWYNHNSENGRRYGALYNFGAVETGRLAPKGWHVATNQEWEELINFLGGKNAAAYRLNSRTGWEVDCKGTDNYGFCAIPGGVRIGHNGFFYELGINAYWWSSKADNELNAMARSLNFYPNSLNKIKMSKQSGLSVRLVKNKPENNSQVRNIGILIDIDGNEYKTIQIGNQIWTAENLKVTRFNDGTAIDIIQDAKMWGSTQQAAMCRYNNNNKTGDEYGALYNFFAVVNGKLAPVGWHVATEEDWEELHQRIGNNDSVGQLLKSSNGWLVNCTNQDDVGFCALPGGGLDLNSGSFDYLGLIGYWWTATLKDNNLIWTRNIVFSDGIAVESCFDRAYLFAIRIVKDSEEPTLSSSKFNQEPQKKPDFLKLTSDNSPSNTTDKSTISLTNHSSDILRTTQVIDLMKDIDGNVYKTVKIGNQIWMAENLKVTRLNDGTPIRNITDNIDWQFEESPGFCHYKNDPVNKGTYGAIYNFFAVETGLLAPKGWHVPTDEEWEQLVNFLGGEEKAGKLLKAKTGWEDNGNGTDEYGFSALSGGYREYCDGSFRGFGKYGQWWSSTARDASNVWTRTLDNTRSIERIMDKRSSGYSVRLVRD